MNWAAYFHGWPSIPRWPFSKLWDTEHDRAGDFPSISGQSTSQVGRELGNLSSVANRAAYSSAWAQAKAYFLEAVV